MGLYQAGTPNTTKSQLGGFRWPTALLSPMSVLLFASLLPIVTPRNETTALLPIVTPTDDTTALLPIVTPTDDTTALLPIVTPTDDTTALLPIVTVTDDTTCRPYEVVCWDGSCASSYSDCPCRSYENQCWDGSCELWMSDCPCRSYEIQCWDESCVQYSRDCPCRSGEIRCWDGTCARLSNGCPCRSYETRCWDGSCKRWESDCSCRSYETMCWDGSCVSWDRDCPCGLYERRCNDGYCSEQCSSPTPDLTWLTICITVLLAIIILTCIVRRCNKRPARPRAQATLNTTVHRNDSITIVATISSSDPPCYNEALGCAHVPTSGNRTSVPNRMECQMYSPPTESPPPSYCSVAHITGPDVDTSGAAMSSPYTGDTQYLEGSNPPEHPARGAMNYAFYGDEEPATPSVNNRNDNVTIV